MTVLKGGAASLWSFCALVVLRMFSVSSVGDEGSVQPIAVRRPCVAASAQVKYAFRAMFWRLLPWGRNYNLKEPYP